MNDDGGWCWYGVVVVVVVVVVEGVYVCREVELE